jgi:transcriptional regulator with XRE-family HTH domain
MKRYPSLAAYLTATGQTQAQFAKRFGLTQGMVSRYVSGQVLPRPKMALRISAATGVTIESMLKHRTTGVAS